MNSGFDVVVAGLGGMGSAALYHLSQTGLKVLGIEQFTPPHTNGSSHGKTRIIRQAYYEGTAYVPMALRAYELWHQLEQAYSSQLLFKIGGLMIGDEASPVLKGSIQSAEKYKLPHDLLSSLACSIKFPQFNLKPTEQALFEPDAGILIPEACIEAHLSLAQKNGAETLFNTTITAIDIEKDAIYVATPQGVIRTKKIVMACGAWTSKFLKNAPLTPEQVIFHWFEPQQRFDYSPEHFPVFIWGHENGLETYGLPSIDQSGLVKVAFHTQHGIPCNPDAQEKKVSIEALNAILAHVKTHFRGLLGKPVKAETCLYTMTPDKHFVLGKHPKHDTVIILAGFSGHGFKFTSAIGELASTLVTEQPLPYALDLSFFSPTRF